jgi:hypothetical protein
MIKELKNIIISCYENKIETNIHIQKMGNAFLNVQQMSAQLHILCCVYHCTMHLEHLNSLIHPHYKNMHLYFKMLHH